MVDYDSRRKKYAVIAFLGLLIAYMAFVVALQALNQDIAFEHVLNSTDLGYNGTRERVHNTTYWANDSALDVYLIFHVVGTGAAIAVDTNISINGTVFLDKDYKTSAGSGVHEHISTYFTVPKGANYSVHNSTNVAYTEWRENKILSGRNGTLSINMSTTTINQTIQGGGGVSFDGSTVNLNGSLLINGSNGLGTFNYSNLSGNPVTNNQSNFYISLTGSDVNPCTQSLPCATINAVWNTKIPYIIERDTYVYFENGTYVQDFTIAGKTNINSYTVYFIGKNRTLRTSKIQTYDLEGSSATDKLIRLKNTSENFGYNTYKGKFIKFTSGTNAGKLRVIGEHNRTHILIAGMKPVNQFTTEDFIIYENNVTIQTTSSKIKATDISLNFTGMNLGDMEITAVSDITFFNSVVNTSGYLNNKIVGSNPTYYLSYINNTVVGSGLWFLGSPSIMDSSVVNGNKNAVTWAGLSQGDQFLIRSGSIVIDTDFGSWAQILGGVNNNGEGFEPQNRTYPYYINNTNGLLAQTGGHILTDGFSNFRGNTLNCNADATSFSWIGTC